MIEELPNNLIEFVKAGESTTLEYKKAKKIYTHCFQIFLKVLKYMI